MVMDDLLFGPDDDQPGQDDAGEAPAAEPWTILVVDDEPQVHAMTSVLLRDFEFEGRPFQIVSALSAAEARRVLTTRPDFPVALIDVVMEQEDAGLRLVRHIREDLGNHRMRIILRTGQPGQAPEREVVVGYDINDYKSKTELTAQKLYTSLVSGLRAWRDIVTIERQRQGLERILSASSRLFATRSMRALVEGMVEQLARVVDHAEGAVLACRPADRADRSGALTIIAGTGRHAAHVGVSATDVLPADAVAAITDAFATEASRFGERRCVLVFRTLEHGTTVFALERPEPYSLDEKRLLEVFCQRMSVGFDNVCLYEDLVTLNQTLERRVADRTAELAANQRALILAKERAELALERELQAKHEQRQFLAMVSHEFRTPLAVIDSAAQLLTRRAQTTDTGMLDRLGAIRMGVQRLTMLIDSYLTDERLQSGNMVPDFGTVDPRTLVRSTLEPFLLAYPGHQFDTALDGLPAALYGDGHLLGLVLVNLINNAIKYSESPARITVSGGCDGVNLYLEVADRGCGIPENERTRVFDRFFRGTNAGGVPGTGIGLHTVQQIVQLHGGSIRVDSRVGQGTAFRVLLPLATE